MTSLLKSTIIEQGEDPSAPQRRAANPQKHVWVRASAGSGKTTVLVKRVLRLMLPDPLTGRYGAPPERILCITYTKAGATNMSIRIQETLMKWSICDDETLLKELSDLFGSAEFHSSIVSAARQLFAMVLDRPDRLRMMTIHSFCQSILARFPLEAGLSPSMTVMEESAAAILLDRSFEKVLHEQSNATNSYIRRALDQFDFISIKKHIRAILSSSYSDQVLRLSPPSLLQIYADHFEFAGDDIESPQNYMAHLTIKDIDLWAQISQKFKTATTKVASTAAVQIDHYISMSADERLNHIDDMISCMEIRPTNKNFKEDSELHALYEYFDKKISNFRLMQEINVTIGMIEIAQLIQQDYARLKNIQNMVDYDDLIMRTQNLLSSDIAWVHYKLDGGIDHILLDESQDTTPAQWNIIQKLSEDMFTIAPDQVEARPRSLFVVGDEKQSIFSFQGADPAVFHRMLDFFKQKTALYQNELEESLRYSFRSTKPILDLVDKTFEPEKLTHSLMGDGQTDSVFHYSHRHTHLKDQAGSVELWLETDVPAQAEQKKSARTPWISVFEEAMNEGANVPNAELRMLSKIVKRIEDEIKTGNWRPEDIMILFRSRSNQMTNLIKMLKWRNLPVSGIDRLVLNKHIVIKDILALAQFVTLNQDDFSLACFLKSPFIGWSEDRLYECAANRSAGQTLWQEIEQNPSYEVEREWLRQIMSSAHDVPVYEWLSSLLIRSCPADPAGSGYRACVARFGQEIMDPLDEMVSDALRLELQDVRSLPDFIRIFGGGGREIKRELSKESGEIRVMTVHASKGLEAPVVILPDTIKTPDQRKTSPVIWVNVRPSGTNVETFKLPLISPFEKDDRSSLYNNERKAALHAINDEEKRLLYVAMTRAEDSLIVAGAYKAKPNYPAPAEESWHHVVSRGFDRLNIPVVNEKGDRMVGQSYSYKAKTKSTGATKTQSLARPPLNESALPSWVVTAPTKLSSTASSRIINPSMARNEGTTNGAMQNEGATFLMVPNGRDRFLRGNITHRLLQILPTIDPVRWESVATSYVARGRFGLSDELQADIVAETLKVLHHPEFHMVFAPGSQAEVPILGRLSSGEVVSGQIDRLYIGDDEILIVDYKTNRPSPQDTHHVPAAYRAQLGLYKELLAQIYPEKQIKTALLWTDRPLFMPL